MSLSRVFRIFSSGLLFAIVSSTSASAQPKPPGKKLTTSLEEIYIARSVRESRSSPTDFCSQSKTGFTPTREEVFTLRSTSLNAKNGKITNTNEGTIGHLHACFGTIPTALNVNFYVEGDLNDLPLKGIGDCRQFPTNRPETGVNMSQCYLHLSGLPEAYVGGLLTTSSLISLELIGTESNPPGYTQVSIATIRLWLKPQ